MAYYIWPLLGFPGDASGKEPICHEGDIRDANSIPWLRRSPGGRHGNPLHYSCLENPRDRGAWWLTEHRVAKDQTGLKQLSTYDLYYVEISSLYTHTLRVFVINKCWIFQNLYLHILRFLYDFYPFVSRMCHIFDLWISNHPCVLAIKPT